MIAQGAIRKLSPQQLDLYYFSKAKIEATKQLQKPLATSFYNISAAELVYYPPLGGCDLLHGARYKDFQVLVTIIRQMTEATKDLFMRDFFIPSVEKWRQWAIKKRLFDQKLERLQRRGEGGGGGGGGAHECSSGGHPGGSSSSSSGR
jgi:hypothetical protein